MLQVWNLDKQLSENRTFHLENISFHIPKGYICGLIGEMEPERQPLCVL